MAIYSKDFLSNSLSGTVVVLGGVASVDLTPAPFALEGNKTFLVKLRKNSTAGEVVATTPLLTITDNSSFVSLTANTYTISEGNLIQYTLITNNAPDNSKIYYSVNSASANVTINDFYNKGNSGYFYINNNQATIILRANTDSTFVDETGEAFTLQLRANSVTGPILYQDTSNVTILDFYKSYRFNSLTANNNNILNGSNIFFTLNTTNANGLTLYYSTTNQTGTERLFDSNTGSIWVNNEAATTLITLASNVAIPLDETRTFQLQVRTGSATGPVLITSNTITMVGYSADNLLTGGTLWQGDGYNYHVFTSSGTLGIRQIGQARPNVQYLIIAGGGGAGYTPGSYPGGGGAGGALLGNIAFNSLSNLTVQVGGGGSGETSPGSNSFIGSLLIAVGGGGGSEGRPGLNNVYPGGSGGGLNLYSPSSLAASSNVIGQGYPGGSGGQFPAGNFAGGGGGAGEKGFPGSSGLVYRMGVASGGNGISVSWLTPGYFLNYGANGFGNVKYFAGGGGGASSSTVDSAPGGFGGAGGNKNGPTGPGATFRLTANVNTGGGAGGAYNTGAISGGSGIVIIKYPYDSFNNLTSPEYAYAGSNITLTANVYTSSAKTLYWSTTGGNALLTLFSSNTGSYTQSNGTNTFVISFADVIPAGETRTFQVQLRTGSTSGPVKYTSNVITVYDSAANLNIIASGGSISSLTDGGKTYTLHAFTTSGTFTLSSNYTRQPLEYVLIAGGGRGGGGATNPNALYGGGGGAGGVLLGNLRYAPSDPVVGTYVATIGAGGSTIGGGPGGSGGRGANGFNSYFATFSSNIVAYGGGGGGSAGGTGYDLPGHPGGSGGGSAYGNPAPTTNYGSGVSGQGYPAGFGTNIPGGGGGAGGAGGTSSPTYEGGDGGIGINLSWMPSSYGAGGPGSGRWFGGGGSGATVSPLAGPAADHWQLNAGGLGGGGFGGSIDMLAANAFMMAGNVNTGGGGGGGGSNAPTGLVSGNGGSGVLFIRYLNPVRQ